jgi:hypothetical protein
VVEVAEVELHNTLIQLTELTVMSKVPMCGDAVAGDELQRRRTMFYYANGEDVRVGDRVRLEPGLNLIVVEVMDPGTAMAKSFECEKTGGVLMSQSFQATSGDLFTIQDSFEQQVELRERAATDPHPSK